MRRLARIAVPVAALALVGAAAGSTARPALKVVISGQGRVTSTPSGISCKPRCTLRARTGEKVTLSATPDSDAEFSHWSAPCGTSSICAVKVTGSRVVHAFFKAKPAPPPPPPPPPMPRPGHYVGTYTDGTFFDLDVQGTQVFNLYFDFNGSCDGGGSSYDTGFTAPGPYTVATDGSFSGTTEHVFTNSTIDATISGTISTAGLASGNMTVSIAFNNGPTCTSRGTWMAQDQS